MDFTHRTGTTCVEPLCEAVGGWDTSKVTTMQAMFNTARSLLSLGEDLIDLVIYVILH